MGDMMEPRGDLTPQRHHAGRITAGCPVEGDTVEEGESVTGTPVGTRRGALSATHTGEHCLDVVTPVYRVSSVSCSRVGWREGPGTRQPSQSTVESLRMK